MFPSPVRPSIEPENSPLPPGEDNQGPSSTFEKDFFVATDWMLIELRREGIATDDQFKIWKELQSEAWTVVDNQALTRRDAHLQSIHSLILSLPIPYVIKAGLERQYRADHVEHIQNHPKRYDPSEQDRAKWSLLHGPTQRLETVYRSTNDISRIVSSTFQTCSISKLNGSNKALQTANNFRPDSGVTVINELRLLHAKHGYVLVEANYDLTNLYSRSVIFPEKLQCSPLELKRSQVKDLSEMNTVLQKLSGELPEQRMQVLHQFKGAYPIVLGPARWLHTENGWSVHSEAFGFRIPYGRFPHTRDQLEQAQMQIEQRAITQFSQKIAGRIDKNFLAWIAGSVNEGHDPIPDVELLYSIPLPSGRDHTFVLKAARSYSCREHVNTDDYPPEDRDVVRALTSHFLNPYHKRSMALLTDFRLDDYGEDLHSHLNHPESIHSLEKYRQLREAWDHSLRLQILESGSTSYQIKAHTELLDPELSNITKFLGHCAKRLIAIPSSQPFHNPEVFQLSPSEQRLLIQREIPALFEIFAAERERAISEEDSPAQLRRIELGYSGPPEGYALPIDHMLMDCIIDFKKRRNYTAHVAESRGIDPAEVKIPLTIGRRYDCTEKFFAPDALVQKLIALEGDSRFGRKVKLTVYDPLSSEKYVEYPVQQHEKLQRSVLTTNHDRMRPVVDEYLKFAQEYQAAEERIEIHQLWAKSLSRLLIDGSKRIDNLTNREKILEQHRRKGIPQIFKDMEAQGISLERRQKVVRSLREENQRETEHVTRLLISTLERVHFLYEQFLTPDLMKVGMRGKTILDQNIVKCIYAIGADGTVVMDFEVPGKARDARVTHSQLLGGKSMYAGGELILAKHDHIFHTLSQWKQFDSELKADPQREKWYALELNNSTGHYRVLSNTLPYAASIIFPALEQAGIPTKKCEIVDRLAPGLRVRGTGVYRF